MTTTDTHCCPSCSPRCGMRLEAPYDGGEAQVPARPDVPVNRGALCGKGRSACTSPGSRHRPGTGARTAAPGDRRRHGGPVCRATWPPPPP
ncbi:MULTISPECIES: hypothetical protein [unclassified Streptomyces]|uniref:hypothetical protein n=1 Tax=unclassified Streptomyces TaxID=2593676 RepID=UPI0036EB3ADC